MDNNKVNIINCYDHLKNLVQEKLNLEKNDDVCSPQYLNANIKIKSVFSLLSEKDFEGIKTICTKEYEQIRDFLNSDIEPSLVAHLSEKLTVNEVCKNHIEKAQEQTCGKERNR